MWLQTHQKTLYKPIPYERNNPFWEYNKPLFQNNHDAIQIRVHDTPLEKIDKTTTEKKGTWKTSYLGVKYELLCTEIWPKCPVLTFLCLAISIYNIICHFTTEVSQPHLSSSKLKSALTQGVPDLSNHYLNLPNNSKNTTWTTISIWPMGDKSNSKWSLLQ